MKNSEIRSKSIEDLKQLLAGEQESLDRLKFAHAISPIENPLRIRSARKLIARINTIIAEKQA